MSHDMLSKMLGKMFGTSTIWRSVTPPIESKIDLENLSNDVLREFIDNANANALMALRKSSRSMRNLVDIMPYMPYMTKMEWPSRIFLNERIRLYRNRAGLKNINTTKNADSIRKTPPPIKKDELRIYGISEKGLVPNPIGAPNTIHTIMPAKQLFQAFAHGARPQLDMLITYRLRATQEDFNQLGTYIENGALSTIKKIFINNKYEHQISMNKNRFKKLDVTPFLRALRLGALPRLVSFGVNYYDVTAALPNTNKLPLIELLRLLGPRLQELQLSMAGINDDACREIFKIKMPNLTVMALDDNSITIGAFGNISSSNHPANNFASLKVLSLRGNPVYSIINEHAFKRIAPNIKTIYPKYIALWQ